MIKGAFLTQPISTEAVSHLSDLGVNQVSLHWESCTDQQVNWLRQQGIKIYAEISLFVGEDLWRKYPQSRPVDRSGHPIAPIAWYHGVCPNHPKVRQEKLSAIDTILEEHTVDGLWLDFIRYPCRWESVRTAQITEYCFCQTCLDKYAVEVGGEPAGEKWVSWKCAQITGFVKEIRDRIEASGRPIELGLFAVPWSDEMYPDAIRAIIGQDFKALSPYVDLFGVMAYHKLIDRPVPWIGEIVESVTRKVGQKVVPLVQTMDDPEKISGDEFKQMLEIGKRFPSRGLIAFHFEDLQKDKDKVEHFKT